MTFLEPRAFHLAPKENLSSEMKTFIRGMHDTWGLDNAKNYTEMLIEDED